MWAVYNLARFVLIIFELMRLCLNKTEIHKALKVALDSFIKKLRNSIEKLLIKNTQLRLLKNTNYIIYHE